jgi:hypothetical protein
LEIK